MMRIKHILPILILLSGVAQKPISAQVIPDQTLGSESSSIRSINELQDIVEGGAIRGDNLFHSFNEFNIAEGTSVNFTNPDGIVNIFSRVTGANISEIFGTLGVNGAANLFLINPNGLVFGENSAIDINGSLIVSTAESIEFNSGNHFSALEPNKPVLTIDSPIGLGMGSNSKEIEVQGSGHQLRLADTSNPFSTPIVNPQQNQLGLNAFSEQTIALIGNKVTFNGGILANPSGNIEVSSIESGIIKINFLSGKPMFDYSQISKFQNILMDNSSLIETSGEPGGNINVIGEELFLSDNSLILNSNFGDEPSGSINIDMNGSINLVGLTSVSERFAFIGGKPGIISQSFESGRGSNINISANQLNLSDFSIIDSTTYASGNGGDININIDESILINGISPVEGLPLSAGIFSASASSGNSGNINLTGRYLSLSKGGLILSRSLQAGTGGDINVNFYDSINLSGVFTLDASLNSFVWSTIGTFTVFSEGGNVAIETSQLRLEGGARVNATTLGQGNAGDITINTTNLIQIDGKITIPNPIDESLLSSTQINASSEIADSSLRELFNLPEFPEGNSGSIFLSTEQLSLTNEGTISVNNQGTGNAGSTEINADSISLDNGGQISATTASGKGGNIVLNSKNLELFNQSQITASAAGSGNGGNITIDSDTILGIQNSDITANAVGGDGGNITINSDAIVGLEERSQLTPFSDITATSEFGIDGTITVNSPESNANEDVVISAKEVDFDPYKQLFKGSCLDSDRKGREELVYVGAGRPESPYNFFDDQEPEALIDSYSTESESNKPDAEGNSVPPLWQEGDPLIEPNAVQTNADGRKFLVAVEKIDISKPHICNRNAEDLELDY